MGPRVAACAVLLLFGCQCGARAKEKAAAPADITDSRAREIVEATGTAAPYVGVGRPAEPPPQQSEREEDREPVAGGLRERTPEPPASPKDDPPIPTTGPFAEEAPAEERKVPADLPPPDASVGSGALEDAGNPLPDPDAHAR